MKKLILFLLFPINLLATNFYVSNSGNDANPGTLAQPWATINRVNSSMGSFVAGDSILFQRGGTFFGKITMTVSGTTGSRITFGAYGVGNNPIITGLVTVSGWVLTGRPNIYRALVNTTTDVNVVTIDDVVTAMGRFPNASAPQDGWLNMQQLTSNSITSQTALTTNWTGAVAVFRNRGYVISNSTITSQALNTMGITPYDVGQEWSSNAGFFIQKDLRTLDTENEWYFNNTTDSFFLYSLTNPSTKTIKTAVQDILININGRSNINIENINFEGCHYDAIDGTPTTNVTIKNCNIRYANIYAIRCTQSSNNVNIQNVSIRDCLTDGILLDNRGSVTNCTLKNIGAILGMAAPGGDSKSRAICIESVFTPTGGNMSASNNVIDSIGYIGIYFGGSNILIKENVITNCGLTKNDGGSIYAYGLGEGLSSINRIIKKNILVNNRRLLYGMPSDYQNNDFRGIYADGYASNMFIDSNVIGNIRGAAYLCNNSQNLYITNTVIYNTPRGFDIRRFTCPGQLVTNIKITRNAAYCFPATLVSSLGNPATNIYFPNPDGIIGLAQCNYSYYNSYLGFPSGQPTNIYSDIAVTGFIDSNYVNNPARYNGIAHTGGCYTNPYIDSVINLPQFRTRTGFELNAKYFPTPNPTTAIPEFVYNPTSSPIVYSFSGLQKKDFKDSIFNNSAIIPPFYGNIFFANGSATGGGLQASSTATQINCFGGNSTVTVSATGGTPPYTGIGTFTRAAGTWSFTVADAATPTPNTITTTITITQPLALTATSSKTDILCNGQTNGSINVFPIGGTPPYSYNWGGGITTQNRTGLAIGTYTCTITDSRNCLTTTSQTITQPTALTAGNPTAPNILVNGGTTTITQPAATGGTSPYQYQLNTGAYQTSNVFSNVSAGTYTINIRDANNCIISKLITITQPVVFSASASAGNISCNGGTTIVVVSASGGTPPYTGTGTFVVTAGAYNYIVTDAGGSTASASITVTQPSALTLSATQVNVLCNGNSTGSINTTPGGGTPPYTYLWNTGQTTQNRTGLSANTYSVTLTDANTCSTSQSITITQPAALSVTATRNPTNILCFGGTSAVTITASGGRSPYSGIGTFNQSVGTITYNVTDANSCPASQSVTLTQPTQLTAANPTATPITVNGGTTTIVQPVPSGGTFPYMYSLNTGAFQTSNAFQNTRAGSYSVTIRDANGCTIIKSITITQPAVFTATATQTVPINCNGQRATIVVSATGGTSPYTGTGTFQVGSGQYVFTVTDSLGNTAPASITVTQPSQVIATSTAGAITSIGGTTNIIVSAVGGIQPYAGTGSFPRQAGTYSFTVTDANGCPSVTNITVNQPTPIPNQSFNSPLPIRNGN